MRATHKGKNVFSTQSFPFLLLILIISACKSEKPSTRSSSQPPVENSTALSAQDTLEILSLIRKKEGEIAGYRASVPRNFDLIHTELDLAFDWENQVVIGKANLTLKPYFYSQKVLVLDAKDFEMGAVYFRKKGDPVKANYGYNEKKLSIYLPEELSAPDTFQVEINYRAFPEKNSRAGSQAITDTKGLYFIDPLDTLPQKPSMIWTQGETEHNSKWFPTLDQPNERMTQVIRLTVPDTLVTVSNGRLVHQEKLGNGLRKDSWEMTLPHAPYLAAIAIGDFVKVEDAYKNIPLGYYVEKGFEKGAKKVFGNTPEMIGFFEDKLGVAYPWPKYDQIVVRDFVSGAMENTTASIFMENLLMDEREAIDSEWDYIIAHELFHQWFGDLVTTESWANLTLNEAFANYSEYLWNEYKYGKDEAALKLVAEMEGYFAEAEGEAKNLIRYYYQDSEDMFDSHSYNKGGVILHMLRKQVGDEAFFKSLNLYLTKNAFKSVEVHDLRMAFEEVTGQDLNWFFNQWFLDKGHPELLLEVDYSQPEDILISVVQAQDLKSNPLFQFPLEVSWYVEGKRESKTFFVNQTFQQFSLQNKLPVNQVYLDERKNLLARRSQITTPQYYLRQLKESQLGVGRYEALDSLISTGNEELLIEAIPLALKDSFWSVRESALVFLQNDPSWGEKISVEDLILNIAENDPRNSVRSSALDLMNSWDAEKYQGVFKRLVNDPSFYVAGSALAGLVAGSEGSLTPLELERFESENNFRMVIPVAEYYLENQVRGKGSWFFEKASVLRAEGLYYFLGYFGEYFSRIPEEGASRATDLLLSMMQTQTQSYLRVGAFQALMGFVDSPEIVAKIREIARKEADETARNYFNYYLEILSEEN
ncbi:M1 family metallopeptidase [Algoriphagus mannitolivorans]|uniref:M1 family metallopeptidase n=1 Tax=Algoriphagus mannitolivorans TaxID=226504 RepID=UPI0004130641|nr:M1 family metallopeptidase [Algoriphagus mannitolivorans]